MPNRADKMPATNTNGVAGLFEDENKAERAVEELKSAGFSEREIGIATAHQEEGRIGKFWDNTTNKFGKHEHTEHAEDCMERCANPVFRNSRPDILLPFSRTAECSSPSVQTQFVLRRQCPSCSGMELMWEQEPQNGNVLNRSETKPRETSVSNWSVKSFVYIKTVYREVKYACEKKWSQKDSRSKYRLPAKNL
jgi:hypothetical protein